MKLVGFSHQCIRAVVEMAFTLKTPARQENDRPSTPRIYRAKNVDRTVLRSYLVKIG